LLFASISAGKLLPYQDYLLFKPSGFERTKAFLQQKSDNDNSSEEVCRETLDEDANLTGIDLEASHNLPVDVNVSAVTANNAECIGESASLQSVCSIKPVDDFIVDTVAGVPDEHIHAGIASAAHLSPPASEHCASKVPHVDYEQLSAENRKRVSEFFSHSRLHHISTWGAEYKAYVAQLQAQVDSSILVDFGFFM